MLIKGTNLTPTQRAQVLAAFVHRPTTGDSEWLASHAFHFVADGSRLSAIKRGCEMIWTPQDAAILRAGLEVTR